jgi:glycosyltransferase involved in cell wall biosynthesis
MPRTMNALEQSSVSVGLIMSEALPGGVAALAETLGTLFTQDLPPREIIIADDRGPEAGLATPPAGDNDTAMRHLPGTYGNRAAMYDAILAAAQGEHLLLVDLERGPVKLRRSALRTLLMAAQRNATGMVYADYARRAADGTQTNVHLLDWHPGRLRDDVDFGPVLLCRTELLRKIGGFDEQYNTAHLYDLRLRLTERTTPVHIANRYAGALYTVTAPAAGHDVFAYLRADVAAQREREAACTTHLKRCGAYLAPGAHVQTVTYDEVEEQRFTDCIASVVIPVNNRPQFIGRAIQSVQAQTETRVETIVVVNGGADDPTATQVRRWMPGGDRYSADAPPVQLIVVDINNLGLCLNTGIAAARGKYYVQLDSDDRLKPDAVAKLLAVFDSDPTVGMVVGSYEVWTLDEQTDTLSRNADIPVVKHEEWTADNGRNNLLRINGAGAPRAAHIKAIAAAGWFGVNDTPHCRNYGEDYDLVLRISERYTIGRVWEPIYDVIRHTGGTDHAIDMATIDRNNNAKDHMRYEALRRRRALNGHADAKPGAAHGAW